MRAFTAAALMVLLSGCSRAAEKAEQEYEFLLSGGAATKSELCAAAQKARDAWAEREDEHKYLIWQVKVSNACLYRS